MFRRLICGTTNRFPNHVIAATSALLIGHFFPTVGGRLWAQDLSVAAAEEDSGSRSNLGASLLQALLANNQAIRSYDVTVNFEAYTLSPTQEARDYVSHFRILTAVDPQARLGVWAHRLERWSNNQELAESSKRIASLLVTPEGDMHVKDVRGIRQLKDIPWERLSRTFRWPSFRTIGLESFPDPIGNDGFWKTVAASRRGLSATPLANGDFAVSFKVENSGSDTVAYQWIFDASTMLPRSRMVSVIVTSTGERLTKERTLFEWKEFSGVFVPHSIHKTIVKRMADEKTGNIVPFELYEDVEFSWKHLDNPMGEVFTLTELASLDLAGFLSAERTKEKEKGSVGAP